MLAACGGERNKKEFLGTPQTPAEGFALCTPDESPKGTVITLPGGPVEDEALCTPDESDFRNISDPGRAAVPLYSIVCI